MKFNLFILLLTLLVFSGCAMQSDFYDVDQRLTAVEQQVLEQQKNSRRLASEIRNFGKNEGAAAQKLRDNAAVLFATLDKVQQDIRLLGGRIDEVEYQLHKKSAAATAASEKDAAQIKHIEEMLGKLDGRVRQIEQYLNLEVVVKSGVARKAAPPPAKPKSENALYLAAKQAFDAGQYVRARSEFAQLVKRYPKSRNADNAQFWIGETYYRQKWYEKAILEYQKVIEKYPHGNKVPASLLKQGLAFFNIGDKVNARLILKELTSKYPHTREAQIAKKKLKEF